MSWIIIYEVIHYLVEGGQNGNFHLRFRANYRRVKMSSERWQHHNVIFTEINANGDHSKMGNSTF